MSFKMPSIPVYTTKHLYRETALWLKDLKSRNLQMKDVLDAPAGGGALTQFLREDLKLSPVAIELDDKKWAYSDVKPILADLSRPLPLPSASFDLVVCLEGLKHFTDVSNAVSEFARVLRPQGYLLMTIPNDLCLQTRARYFFDGWVDIDWIQPMDPKSHNERDHFHLNSLVSLPYLAYFMEKNNLDVVRTGADRLRFWSVVLAAIFYPILYLVTAARLPRTHFLRREMVSLAWLAGRRN
ncbi:MAG: class I SAM-dependent methyltransferase [Bdellovibrionales bacterium]|nr:class I SAM-dependent methyltransferase [Bdellovibrionales bacterium]